MEVVGGWFGGEAEAPMRVEAAGGLAVALGVTTAGEPGPRSIKLSSVASPNIWETGRELLDKKVSDLMEHDHEATNNWDFYTTLQAQTSKDTKEHKQK